MLITGGWQELQRLRVGVRSGEGFQCIPGIGPALDARIRDVLGIHTLEGLEVASRDGCLAALDGVGSRRAAVGEILDRGCRNYLRGNATAMAEPSVALLLQFDSEYRQQAAAGTLPTIAPRRMNPERKAWLPVRHAIRSGWHFTALFSNTPRAHELGRTDDWVVIYFHSDEDGEARRTIVTETRGALVVVGLRVVRGWETESRAYWAGRDPEMAATVPDLILAKDKHAAN